MTQVAEFTITYTPADRQAAAFRFLMRSLGPWVALAEVVVLVGGLLLAFFSSDPVLGIWVIAFAVVYPAAVIGVMVWRSRNPTPLQTGTFHFVATEEGLHLSSEVVDQTIKWVAYRSFDRDSRYLYLHLARYRAQMLPLRDQPEVAALCRWLTAQGMLKSS